MCTVAILPKVRRLSVTSYAVSKPLHHTEVPSSANVEKARSFCDVTESGVNVSSLRADLSWVNFLEETRDATVLNPDDVWKDEELP